jgi:23S rRNA (uracil1939-C5)-methyltransferase
MARDMDRLLEAEMDPDRERELMRRLREKLGMPERRDERAELERLFGGSAPAPEARVREELEQDRPGVGHRESVRIEALAFDGRGLTSIQRRPAFVDGPVPGDTVIVEITREDRTAYQCRLVETVARSSDRVPARCAVFGRCAGCYLQCVAYPAQLKIKQRMIEDLCRRLPEGRAILVRNVVPSPETYGYRTRIRLHVEGDSGGIRLLMPERPGGRPGVSMESCPLCNDTLNGFLRDLPELLRAQQWRGRADAELLAHSEEEELLLAWSSRERLDAQALLAAAGERGHSLLGVTLRQGDRRRRQGETCLVEMVGPENHAVSLERFFPDNTTMMKTVRDQLIRVASPVGTDRLLLLGADAAFAVPPLAALAGTTRVADPEEEKLEDLADEEDRIVGPLERVFEDPRLKGAEREPTLVVHHLGEGQDGAVAALRRQQVEKLLLTTDEPRRFAAALRELGDAGYRVKLLQPLDLWPHTRHIFIIALLGHPLAAPSIHTKGWDVFR